MPSSSQCVIVDLGTKCCGCSACAAICPLTCITMVEDAEGFMHPVVDLDRCIGCDKCSSVCPALQYGEQDEVLSCFWAKAIDDKELCSSSSGGLFGLLAESVLGRGGVVYGAAFSEGAQTLTHIRVASFGDLDALRRSKYLQSRIDSCTYDQVRSDLGTGLMVVYCGTPCQILGLRKFLETCGVDTSNLVAVDIFCHGVPSPKLWRAWLRFMEDTHGARVVKVNFRDKKTGWASYSVTYEFDNGNSLSVNHNDDWYMRAFLANASIRPSCFACPAKRSCESDLTLGDYWGIAKTHPEVKADGGVSAVIVNTPVGDKAFSDMSSKLEYGRTSFESIASGNRSVVVSSIPFGDYDSFMAQLADGLNISQMRRKWSFEKPLIRVATRKIKSFIKHHGKASR